MQRKRINLILGFAFGGAAVIAIAGILVYVKAGQQTLARAGSEDISGQITIAQPNDGGCKRFVLDNTTGTVMDQGRGSCVSVMKDGEGSHFNAIARAFRHQ
jgi:hypothetical protein